jgi:NAD(P)H dehydrogenase (quinone)
MAVVLVVYATDYGSTKKMADAIAQGAAEVDDVTADVVPAEEATKEQVLDCDALVLGSPVHMGSMDWRVKKFIDTVCSPLWMDDQLNGRVGAVFACGSGFGNAGGGCELAMLSMLNNLVELGLIICPLPKNTPGYPKGGLQWGPYARAHHEDITPIEGGAPRERIEACGHHGAHIARLAKIIAGQKVFMG